MTKLSTWLGSAALLCSMGLFAAPASAAPVGNVSGLQTQDTFNVDKVDYGRRCWRHRGHLHCRRYARYYDYDYGYPYYGGYGYGPSIGLYFGGGGRHWGGGHRFHGGHRHR